MAPASPLESRLVDDVAGWLPLLAALADRSDDELLAGVERIGSIRRLVDTVGAHLAGELERRCGEGALAARLGEKSAAAIVSSIARIEPVEAHAWCQLGAAIVPRSSFLGERLEPRRPALVAAVGRPDVGVLANARIAATLDELERRTPDQVDAATALLIEHAPWLTTRELARVCHRLIDAADPDGVEPRENELRRRSGLDVSRTPDGMLRWVVTMHPEAEGFLSAALDARTAPRRQPHFTAAPADVAASGLADDDTADGDTADGDTADTRTLALRRLDALVSIARESLEHDPGRVAGTAVTMVVTIPLQTLVDGVGAASIEGVDAPISAATARRLAAQADLIPMVLGGSSEPLDLGTSQRLFSAAQRRMVAHRDGGCVWTGCTAPPGWCELAHIEPWASGGPTDLDNALLLCPYHHRRFDLDGWSLERRAGRRYLIPPSCVDARRRPRPIDRPSLAA